MTDGPSTRRGRELTVGVLSPEDRGRVAEILQTAGNFRPEEIDVALELFDESFAGPDYRFVGAYDRAEHPCDARRSTLAAFACFGPTPCTDRTFDLYWLAVDHAAQGTGCGTLLLSEVERRLEALHARLVVVETSSRSEYATARAFYRRRGYVEAARVREFYAPEDDRIILTKRFAGSPRRGWGAVA